MRVGIVTYPGTLDEQATMRALADAGLAAETIWHTATDLLKFDALVIAGGKSYGDYLRPGALARTAPVTDAVIAAANKGLPVLGIGNGFQILLESGLLPGALALNHQQTFLRHDQEFEIVKGPNNTSPWLQNFKQGEKLCMPIRHSHGAFTAEESTVERIEGQGQVVLRYLGENPNGSINNIAGVTNDKGNVVGIMGHPEYASELGFGPDTSERMRSGVDGLKFFAGLV